MNNFNINNLEELLFSIKDKVRSEIERVVNLLLETELTEFLQYEKYEYAGYNSGNSRNGYYERTITTEYGDIKVKVPRDRNGLFTQQTLNPYARRTDDLETLVIHLYKKGITTREISELIEKMYGHYYSPSTVSNITDTILKDVEAFHQRSFNQDFIAVFMDATFIPIQRGRNYTKEAVLIAIGIDKYGHKQVLDYMINPGESLEIYQEMLLSLKERGVNSVDIFVTDGFKGMRDVCLDIYPESKHQVCWTHLVRNAYKKVKKADRSSICEDLKLIYASKTKEEAQTQLDYFYVKYEKKYPKVVNMLYMYEQSLFSYLDFPEIARSLYTTNIIENFNKLIKRDIPKKQSFPTVESLDKFIYLIADNYNIRFANKIHRNFSNLL